MSQGQNEEEVSRKDETEDEKTESTVLSPFSSDKWELSVSRRGLQVDSPFDSWQDVWHKPQNINWEMKIEQH